MNCYTELILVISSCSSDSWSQALVVLRSCCVVVLLCCCCCVYEVRANLPPPTGPETTPPSGLTTSARLDNKVCNKHTKLLFIAKLSPPK